MTHAQTELNEKRKVIKSFWLEPKINYQTPFNLKMYMLRKDICEKEKKINCNAHWCTVYPCIDDASSNISGFKSFDALYAAACNARTP